MANAYTIVAQFEQRVADFTGAPFAVAVDSCTSALLLCCDYLRVGEVTIPRKTYCSVPMSIIHAGGRVRFEDREWQGAYRLDPYPIWDAAKRMRRGMYAELGGHVALSLHIKKSLPVGRGGVILTDDAEAARYFRMARRDGRDDAGEPGWQAKCIGRNAYLSPEQAARALMLMDVMPADGFADQVEVYPDLSTWAVFRNGEQAA